MRGVDSPAALRREDEVAVLQRQRLPAQDPRLERPEHERDHDEHRRHAAALQEAGGDHEQRDRRDDEEDVDEQVDDVVDEPARVGGGDAEDDREGRGEEGRAGAEQQRPARAEHDLREDVAALVGGAEEVVPRRRLPRGEQVEVVRVRDADPGSDHGDHHHEADHREPGGGLRVAQHEREPAGHVEPAADAPRRSREREVDRGVEGGIELRHQAVRRRGSRTRLSRSMIRFATITQTERTTSSACASG